MDRLRVAETFYSLQGEGRSCGRPAVFLRLQHCNLLCGSGDASWRCDTLAVWQQGKARTFAEISDYWRVRGWLQHLAGHAHLVVTGGEPLLQQPALTAFLHHLYTLDIHPFVEIETNATLTVSAALDACVAQYNCSPKGANSGNPPAVRHNVTALRAFVANPKAIFKFVVSSPQDLPQLCEEYIERYAIAATRVWLMPAAETRAELQACEQQVFALCQEHRFNYSTRLQIQVWDQATGI